MVVFLLLLILAVFAFVLSLSEWADFTLTIILLSFFIANTIDLIIITIQSIKSELEIDEIYNI